MTRQIHCQSSEVVYATHPYRRSARNSDHCYRARTGQAGRGMSVVTERARFMARQPGFISISLHRSLDGRRIVNYVQWQSRDLLRSAHQNSAGVGSLRSGDGRDRSPSVRW
ncbi:antibiotic biosynthesis monooxygenase family protein [Mesorhizobium sp. M0184]|uniref:antibiotic biosynthesis monooxygenase family protein n=1 Tax=unclassified Mesorhizobium TaxID=325217 RepID=UPI00333D97FA